MPQKNKFFGGVQSYMIFERDLEDEFGKVESQQEFIMLSYGVFDWLAIDLKAGFGGVEARSVAGVKTEYDQSFSGGYGLRWKFFERDNWKAVAGFQHISVHPQSTHVGNDKNKAILDDWQVSLLASYTWAKFTPYLGTRWSRTDYIHTVNDDRKRKMSNLTRDIGMVLGMDFALTEKIWLNLEGSAFDNESLAASVNYRF